ncbi:HAD family hydrolase [Paenibacillus sabinae]|uniref:Uncharacterized protein n=1 Tax=Paenibacillus sabinae T27 TaxID=1268072 RepID=X5A4S9_9BACL|nr:HAD-IA family hydrolase [Paenibacillus sabinae]AHV99273.1 hypothetical protein PSAB_21920 [Paenibacillus sabinae T27]
MNHLELIEKIKRVKVVSFDIFDTLILRKIEKPIHVFELIENFCEKAKETHVEEFALKRQQAEKAARDNVWMKERRTEVTIDEIYQEFQQETNKPHSVCEALKDLELNFEKLLCTKNEYMYEVYNECLKLNKSIIITSDMYLTHSFIKGLLTENGYKDYSKIYLSSELKITKATGELYSYIIQDLKIKPDEILHIGDNYHADIEEAQKKGIVTHYYPKCLDQNKKLSVFQDENSIETNILKGLINNKLFSSRKGEASYDFWYYFGYENVGLIYLSFIQWLYANLKQNDIEAVFFLSRDGFIMKKVFELMGMNQEFSSKYLYASRRALNFASIKAIDEDSLNFLVSGTSRLKVKEFLQRIGLNEFEYRERITKVGFPNEDHIVDSGEDYAKLRDLYASLSEVIADKATKERELLIEYLRQEEFFDYKKIAIVDIGWHGSMQFSLEKMIEDVPDKPEIFGYYFGTYEQAQRYIDQGLKLQGYLCDLGQPDEYYKTIKLCVEVFEFIFGAPHGSVINFYRDQGYIKPTLESTDMDQEKNEKLIAVQNGALDFVKEIEPLVKESSLILDIKTAIRPLQKILSKPSIEEAVRLGDLVHAEGFGEIYVKRYVAKPSTRISLLFNPAKLVKEYRNSFWKAGYLKRLTALNNKES